MSLRVAFQGVAGAFGHEAALAAAPGARILPRRTFAGVAAALERGLCDLAVLPVENSTAGPVAEALAVLRTARAERRGELVLPIRLQLLSAPGVDPAGLKSAASHPVALAQCADALARRGLEPAPVFDTAGAARALAARPSRRRAAVASRAAADLYGLTVVEADVQDRADNATRFLILAPPQ